MSDKPIKRLEDELREVDAAIEQRGKDSASWRKLTQLMDRELEVFMYLYADPVDGSNHFTVESGGEWVVEASTLEEAIDKAMSGGGE